MMDSKTLHEQLFNTEHNVYTVIDGASVPALLAKLEEYEPESTCLFRGELTFDLAEAAPYLVKLEEDNLFSEWIVQESIDTPCCVYAYSEDDFFTLRKHFRSLLKVESPEGKILHFRYYDPRVMEVYLPTCTVKDNDVIFNKVKTYLTTSCHDLSFRSFKETF